MTNSAGIRSYLKAASEAELESFEKHSGIIGYLDDLDGLFRKLVTGKAYAKHPATGFLGMNAHAAYLSAASLALRGQSPPTFMVMRGCIESALYAFLISLDVAEGKVWLSRDKDIEVFKSKFSANRAIQKIDAIDPALAAMLKDTYQWMIEFGAHPNPRAVIAQIREKEKEPDGEQPYSLIYIHSGDSGPVIRCLSACIENGCMAVATIVHATPKHPECARIFDDTWRLFKSFQKHLVDIGYFKESSG